MENNESAIMKICMELRASAALEGDDIYLEGEVTYHLLRKLNTRHEMHCLSFPAMFGLQPMEIDNLPRQARDKHISVLFSAPLGWG
eukprot:COSAG06_NODE_4799_length_3945_cov_8.420376_6_plen_86_part_00